jgi:hypothetical protein
VFLAKSTSQKVFCFRVVLIGISKQQDSRSRITVFDIPKNVVASFDILKAVGAIFDISKDVGVSFDISRNKKILGIMKSRFDILKILKLN